MKKGIRYIIRGLLLWIFIHVSIMLYVGLVNDENKVDVAVIFGNTVNEDGTLSDRLKARVDEGYEIYSKGIAKTLFVSGGLGKEGHFEGTKMKDYLIEKGVPERAIKVDNKGDNTWATALNFRSEFNSETKVILISQYHHLLRAKLAFKKQGITIVKSASPSYFEWRDLYAIPREFLGYYAYLLK